MKMKMSNLCLIKNSEVKFVQFGNTERIGQADTNQGRQERDLSEYMSAYETCLKDDSYIRNI